MTLLYVIVYLLKDYMNPFTLLIFYHILFTYGVCGEGLQVCMGLLTCYCMPLKVR